MPEIVTDGVDRRWVEVCEMDMGADDPFDEFAEKVVAKMAELGNDVERPLTMKVAIDVKDGLIERDGEGDDA